MNERFFLLLCSQRALVNISPSRLQLAVAPLRQVDPLDIHFDLLQILQDVLSLAPPGPSNQSQISTPEAVTVRASRLSTGSLATSVAEYNP